MHEVKDALDWKTYNITDVQKQSTVFIVFNIIFLFAEMSIAKIIIQFLLLFFATELFFNLDHGIAFRTVMY